MKRRIVLCNDMENDKDVSERMAVHFIYFPLKLECVAISDRNYHNKIFKTLIVFFYLLLFKHKTFMVFVLYVLLPGAQICTF